MHGLKSCQSCNRNRTDKIRVSMMTYLQMEMGGARVRLEGNSGLASMFTQKRDQPGPGCHDCLRLGGNSFELTCNYSGECERIRQCKGRVHASKDEPDVQRLWPAEHDDMGLVMSRAFGDFCLKRCGHIAVPEITYRKITDRDEFVVLASDGVWDVLSNTEVIQIVASATKRSLAAKMLVKKAVRAWRYKYPDNCAVVCLFLKKPSPRQSTTIPEGANSWTMDSWHSCRTTEVISQPSSKIAMADSKEEYTALEGDTRVISILSLPRFPLTLTADSKSVV